LSDDWHGVSEQWIRNWDSSDRSNGQPLFLPASVPFPRPFLKSMAGLHIGASRLRTPGIYIREDFLASSLLKVSVV
jgi:hypothetical protein